MAKKDLRKQYRHYLKSLKVSSRSNPQEILTFEEFVQKPKRKILIKVMVCLVFLLVCMFSISNALDIDRAVKNNDLNLLNKLESLSLFDWTDLNSQHLSTAIIYKNFDLACEILQKNKTIKIRPSVHWVGWLSKSKKALECVTSHDRFSPLDLGVKKYSDSIFFMSKNLNELETGLKLGANPNRWYFYGYKRTKTPEYIYVPTKVTRTCQNLAVGKIAPGTCMSHSVSIESKRVDLPDDISLEDAREIERKFQDKNEFSVDVSLKFKMLKMYYWPLKYAMKSKETKKIDLLMKYGAKQPIIKKSARLKDVILL